MQPGIQLKTAIESGKPVIGHHDEFCGRRASSSLADRLIHGLVGLEKFSFISSPQHVRVLIYDREVGKQEPTLKIAQAIAEQPPLIPLTQGGFGTDLGEVGMPPTPTQVVSGGFSTGGKTRMPSSGGRTVPFHFTGCPVRPASRRAAKIASFSSKRNS